MGEIYELERQVPNPEKLPETRLRMLPLFEDMARECEKIQANVMPKSKLEKAINYFLNYYDGLTKCTKDSELSLDNNSSERSLRSSVVGGKTWYGTHSKRGAKTNCG